MTLQFAAPLWVIWLVAFIAIEAWALTRWENDPFGWGASLSLGGFALAVGAVAVSIAFWVGVWLG